MHYCTSKLSVYHKIISISLQQSLQWWWGMWQTSYFPSVSKLVRIRGYDGFPPSCDHFWAATSGNRAVGVKKIQMKLCCFASNGRLLFQAKEDAARLSAWVPWHSTSSSASPSCVVSQTQLHILWGEVRSRIFGEGRETEWARVCL